MELTNLNNSPRGLKWIENSCYIDVVLQSLFGPSKKNIFIKEILSANLNLDLRKNIPPLNLRKEIQNELYLIFLGIRGKISKNLNISILRTILKKCGKLPYNFCDNIMGDAGEFLSFLLSLFSISETAIKEIISFGTNDLIPIPLKTVEINRFLDRNSNIIVRIDPFLLMNIPLNLKVKLSNFLTIKEDSNELEIPYQTNGIFYKRKIDLIRVIYSPVLIFYIDRVNPLTGKYIPVKIFPDTQIYLEESHREIELTSIILYDNHHYTCIFKNSGLWYHYNDMRTPQVILLGQELKKEMVEYMGTHFFYY